MPDTIIQVDLNINTPDDSIPVRGVTTDSIDKLVQTMRDLYPTMTSMTLMAIIDVEDKK